MSQFDSLIIGEVAQDTNVDYDGATVQAIGGAVYYSGFAAANIGHKIAVLPKADMAPEEHPLLCDQKRIPHPGPGAAHLHGGQRY